VECSVLSITSKCRLYFAQEVWSFTNLTTRNTTNVSCDPLTSPELMMYRCVGVRNDVRLQNSKVEALVHLPDK
jgi:hypothetical protein